MSLNKQATSPTLMTSRATRLEQSVTNAVLEQLETLVSPFGVVADVHSIPAPRGIGKSAFMAAYFGQHLPLPDPSRERDAVRPSRPPVGAMTSGFGRALDAEQARLTAIAEAAERYSACGFDEPVVCAAFRDLDGPALDIERIPRCSPKELEAPGCRLRTLDPGLPIRWIQATDLSRGDQTWIPAIMAYYRLRDVMQAERFWIGVSTGYAVHTDPAEALVRGICEVIERDAIAITWLQKLSLPVVASRWLSEETLCHLERRRQHFIDDYLFDATTDIGVPTVLCLSVAPHDSQYSQVMTCATGRTLSEAAQKALIDAYFVRPRNHPSDASPADPRDFRSPFDGARYMASPDRISAFDFLLDGACDRVSGCRERHPARSMEMLDRLVTILSSKDMQVLVMDRTTAELAGAGLTAVNVIIPDLQPMSLLPQAQYRAHYRLYSAPILMGYRSLIEEELNPWPMPFD
jgi:ribosomal protein S12 methylthiotransferase accessory factor